MSDSTERLLVKAATSVEERVARGDLMARVIFHENVEKVYYFVKGSGEVDCGPWTKPVKAGDFLFFPAAIEHEIRADEGEDLEFVVCASKTLSEPRGLAD